MKVSVILPTYNGAKRISKAIESVRSQSLQDWELIVVDDGSTDDTSAVIHAWTEKDARIRYVRNDINQGIQKSGNRGIREARGIYIGHIDDDDEWVDVDKLKKQIEFLDANPDYALLGTSMIIVNEEGKELFRYMPPLSDEDIRQVLLVKNCFSNSSVLFRRDFAQKVGGYDEGKGSRHAEDYDLWMRLGTHGKMANLPIYALRYMKRDDSISGAHKLEQLRKYISLAWRYRKQYPHFVQSEVRSIARLLVYAPFTVPPLSFFRYGAYKIYKKFFELFGVHGLFSFWQAKRALELFKERFLKRDK